MTIHVAGDWNFYLFCRAEDDGELAIPAELTSQLPLPTDASIVVKRADIRLVATDDGRSILASASTSTWGNFALQ